MSILQSLQNKAHLNVDMRFQHVSFAGLHIDFVGLTSLIDFSATISQLRSQVYQDVETGLSTADIIGNLGISLQDPTEDDLLSFMLCGQMIAWIEQEGIFIRIFPVSRTLSRSIESPTTENVLRGPISSFVEDIDTNIGLIRKHMASEQLQVRAFHLGSSQAKRLVMMYNDDAVDLRLRDQIMHMLEQNQSMDVENLQKLAVVLGFGKWSFVTKFNTSEMPQEAESALQKGKVILLLDRMPFAIIMPSLIWDMFAVENDRSFPSVFMYAVRFLRILGVLMNILIPGLYVALVSVNPEVLRIELALSIARSRMDVPYPSLIETLLLLFILELILEASIRLPKSIGPTLTMVGGIILGQAVVSAKLVSNLLIIILAATTIATSVVVGFQNSVTIRLFKYVLVLLSAVYGIIGLLAGLFLICTYMASITTYGIPYVYIMKPRENSHG